MRQVMSGDATDAQIGGLLVALRMKGETTDEIAGAAQVMRELATPVTVSDEHLVDLVGTGGDGANLFNVSTASSFVVAAAGARVAKHGNRSVSSTSGSSDVLEHLGMPLDLSPSRWRARSTRSAWASCSPRPTTAPCATLSARAGSWGCAQCSISSGP